MKVVIVWLGRVSCAVTFFFFIVEDSQSLDEMLWFAHSQRHDWGVS